jgi:hypothetical protein
LSELALRGGLRTSCFGSTELRFLQSRRLLCGLRLRQLHCA